MQDINKTYNELVSDLDAIPEQDLIEPDIVCENKTVPEAVNNFIDTFVDAFKPKQTEHDLLLQEVESPDHYCQGTYETIDEMVLIFGYEATINFCKCNVWKYRSRAPYKGDQRKDEMKADQYLQMIQKLEGEMNGEYK